jgi:hypothetical protein
MAKDLTAKDVLYALEYLGDALERISIRDGKAVWRMRSGSTVKDRIADEVRSNANVQCSTHLSRQTVTWRAVA